jgi:hypothetical protein
MRNLARNSPRGGRRAFAKNALAGSVMLAVGDAWSVRPLKAKEAPIHTYLDVTEFGAKGDGKTDDTRAIQAALDTVVDVNGLQQPVSVFLPPGVYCSSRLQMHSNSALTGIPGYDYERPGGSQIKLIDPSVSCLIDISGARGVTIRGISLNGDRLGRDVHGVMRDDPDPSTNRKAQETPTRIEECRVAHFSGDGVHMMHSWVWTIRDSMIAFNAGNGVNYVGWDGWLLNCWLSGNKKAGLMAHGPVNFTSAVTVTANRIEWNGQEGILIADGSGMIQITGNYFDRSYFSAVAVTESGSAPCSQITITGNFFYRSGKSARPETVHSSHLRLEGASGIACTGNAFRAGNDSGSDRGPCSPSYGILYQNLLNSVITNNVLHQGALKTLISGSGGNGVIVNDNPGSLLLT